MSASWLKNSLLGAVLLGLIALGVSAPQLCSRHLPLRWIEINGDFQRLSAEQIPNGPPLVASTQPRVGGM